MTAAASPRRSGGRETGATAAVMGLSSAGRIGGAVTRADDGDIVPCEILLILRDVLQPHKHPGHGPALVAETTRVGERPRRPPTRPFSTRWVTLRSIPPH